MDERALAAFGIGAAMEGEGCCVDEVWVPGNTEHTLGQAAGTGSAPCLLPRMGMGGGFQDTRSWKWQARLNLLGLHSAYDP